MQQKRPSTQQPRKGDAAAAATIGDAERSALTFTSYDLTAHIRPSNANLSMLARVTVRNNSSAPLLQLPLQISSSLHWDGASQTKGGRIEKLTFTQHLLQTDADHTGQASEAILQLREPLAPGSSTNLTLLYSGSILTSTVRLDRAGVCTSGPAADWDVISPAGIFLRGFGDVLWYPAASPQIFLGEGATFLQATGQQMLRQSGARARLRVSVEYTGEAPGAIFFCGLKGIFAVTSDDADAAVSDGAGIATAEFRTEDLGFRSPSLFVTGKPEPSSIASLSVVSSAPEIPKRLASAALPILDLLTEWMGGSPAADLTVVDHPGDPYGDGSVLVAPISGADTAALSAVLLPSLVQVRFRSAHVWLTQGLTELMRLTWIERQDGRAAALHSLEEMSHSLALAESVTPNGTSAQGSLLSASEAVFYRSKAAAVLWQLRDMVGQDALKETFRRYGREPKLDQDSAGFEKLLEQVSGKNLQWFFDDWVYHDRGLPDLSIASVAPRELESRASPGGGWLVAVEVRNDGGAVADVAVTVRSGTLTASERLRINAHSVASTRILFQGVPAEIQVNDGSVPEMITSTHIQDLAPH